MIRIIAAALLAALIISLVGPAQAAADSGRVVQRSWSATTHVTRMDGCLFYAASVSWDRSETTSSGPKQVTERFHLLSNLVDTCDNHRLIEGYEGPVTLTSFSLYVAPNVRSATASATGYVTSFDGRTVSFSANMQWIGSGTRYFAVVAPGHSEPEILIVQVMGDAYSVGSVVIDGREYSAGPTEVTQGLLWTRQAARE